jgi:ribosomal subunit interface protein
MQIAPQVSFQGIPVSDAVERACWEECEKLERFYDRITSCRVVITEPHQRHRKGNLYSVRIDLTVPGREIVVSREQAEHRTAQDVHLALREAFAEARRQLQDHVRRQEPHRAKRHESELLGRVTRLDAFNGFGFLEAPDGREVYFHENCVRGGSFEGLELGARVRFGEGQGERGPQATWIQPVSEVR